MANGDGASSPNRRRALRLSPGAPAVGWPGGWVFHGGNRSPGPDVNLSRWARPREHDHRRHDPRRPVRLRAARALFLLPLLRPLKRCANSLGGALGPAC
eukprot:COSAG06_NODE_1666_length_8759_cov_35.338915_3_plen_99_part_00